MNEIEKQIHEANAARQEREREACHTLFKTGKPFEPIKRPKGYRKRKDNECFFNAAMLAIDGRGRYVEGFTQGLAGFMVHHAWVTLDGVHAIEATWQEPGTGYFGVEVPAKIIAKAMLTPDASGFVTVSQFELPTLLDVRATP